MEFVVPKAMKMTVMTENGIARRVFVDGKEFTLVQGIEMKYGIDSLPVVTLTFIADVKVKEKGVVE